MIRHSKVEIKGNKLVDLGSLDYCILPLELFVKRSKLLRQQLPINHIDYGGIASSRAA